MTPDGRYLLVADGGSGVAIFDIARAEQGVPGSLIGELASPRGDGATEVAVSPDGRYALVTLEKSDAMAVFDLGKALGGQGGGSPFVGQVPLPLAPVGVAVSPDDRWVYVTSEGGAGRDGLLSVVSLAQAVRGPSNAVVAQVPAGCSPVRVITSFDGSFVWVSARGSNEVLAFSAARLLSDPSRARVAHIEVGAAPVGLALIDDGRFVAVADSNRFGASNARGDIRFLDVSAVLAGRTGPTKGVPAGTFPRELTIEPGAGTLLVTNYGSGTLEAVDIAGLR